MEPVSGNPHPESLEAAETPLATSYGPGGQEQRAHQQEKGRPEARPE